MTKELIAALLCMVACFAGAVGIAIGRGQAETLPPIETTIPMLKMPLQKPYECICHVLEEGR